MSHARCHLGGGLYVEYGDYHNGAYVWTAFEPRDGARMGDEGADERVRILPEQMARLVSWWNDYNGGFEGKKNHEDDLSELP